MAHKRRHRRRRHNPVDTKKIAWGVGIAVALVGVGVGVYYATKKSLPAAQGAPPGNGGTTNPSGGAPAPGPTVSPATVAVATAPATNNSGKPPPIGQSQAPMSFAQAFRNSPPPIDQATGNY
jgi:hypothetical protein